MTSILVKDGIIVTMDPSHRILSDHSIIIEDGKFRAIGKTDEIARTGTLMRLSILPAA